MFLGNYILEGPKAGAAAAAVWMAHWVVPRNLTGYGRLIGRSIEGAWRFYHSLLATRAMQVGSRTFQVAPLTELDFNIVGFAFNEAGNTSLEVMDALNQAIDAHCSYTSGPVYAEDFLSLMSMCSPRVMTPEILGYGHLSRHFCAGALAQLMRLLKAGMTSVAKRRSCS